jgi:hypothetical protein
MTEITQADRDAAAQYDVVEAFARHRMEERAAIVAWLRKDDFLMTADAIEAGEHLK